MLFFLSVKVYYFWQDIPVSYCHFYWGQLCKEALGETPDNVEENQKREVDWEWEREEMEKRQDGRLGRGGTRVGQINAACVVGAFFIWTDLSN